MVVRVTGCADCTRVSTATCCACAEQGKMLDLLCLGNQPPANAYHRPGEPHADRYPLHRGVCGACGVEQVISRPDPDLLYQNYRYLSGANPRWLEHVEALAGQVSGSLAEAPFVVDIGSNDGSLLAAYQRHGAEVWGIEPCKELAEQATECGRATIHGFLGDEAAGLLAGQADVIHAHNVWGHFSDPVEAASCMATMLKQDGQIIIETPWLADTVQHVEFDTLYHEHRSTWTLSAVEKVLASAGLWVLRAEALPIHGGSLRIYAGKEGAATGSAESVLQRERDVLTPGWTSRFAEQVQTFTSGLAAWLRSANAAGLTIAAYGAAAKATVLIHATPGATDLIEFVVDDAPAKQGLCMPGSDIAIGPRDWLLEVFPDAVLVLAWNWADSIAAGGAKQYLDAGGVLVAPDPSSPSAVRVIGGSVG